MKRLIMGCLLITVASSMAHANYVEKTRIEENIQLKAQHILDTMYGPHQFSVSVSVDLGRESWIVSYTDRADINFKESKNTPAEKYKILPGYSAIKNLSPNEAVQMPFNSKISKLPADILKVTLILLPVKQLTSKRLRRRIK